MKWAQKEYDRNDIRNYFLVLNNGMQILYMICYRNYV